MIRQFLQSHGFVVGAGLILGATSVLQSWAPLVGLAGVLLLFLSARRPSVPIALAFAGILLDARGMTSLRAFGLPVTISKVMVLYAVSAHLLHAMLERRPLMRRMPTTGGMFAVVCTMLLSLVAAVDPALGYMDVAGVIMLVFMTHLFYTSVPEPDLPWMLRFMSLTTAFVLSWTLLTQRKEGFFVTLDHAWQQRTSGAYGDPNAWSTCLLVVCPMLIAFLVTDRHWASKALLFVLGITFPACIFQSMSRAGLIAFVLISPGILWMVRQHRTVLLAAVVGLVAITPFIINVDAAMLRYQTLIDPTLEADLGHGSLRERAALLDAGVRIFFENPVLGVGVGLFRMHASYVSAGEVWKIAHNSYINVAAEQGVPGLIAHLYLGWQVWRGALNAWNKPTSDAARTFGFGFVLSLTAFCIMALTLNLASFAVAWYMLSMGLLMARYNGAEEVHDPLELPHVGPVVEVAAR